LTSTGFFTCTKGGLTNKWTTSCLFATAVGFPLTALTREKHTRWID
jgi:hypothetical protein